MHVLRVQLQETRGVHPGRRVRCRCASSFFLSLSGFFLSVDFSVAVCRFCSHVVVISDGYFKIRRGVNECNIESAGVAFDVDVVHS